jgi:CubicO group peptidase (beta-lactamase class C family)
LVFQDDKATFYCLIIEKASGMTYEEYVEKRIFEPLGMRRSMYCNSSEDVPRRANGHFMKQGPLPSSEYASVGQDEATTDA